MAWKDPLRVKIGSIAIFCAISFLALPFYYLLDALVGEWAWLVSEKHPIRDVEGLDYYRCAKLHNLILLHAWEGAGRSKDSFPTTTWWDRYGEQAANISERSPSLVEFYKRAIVLPPGSHISFFYFVSGLSSPRSLYPNDALWYTKEHREFELRFPTIYWSNYNWDDLSEGVIYDVKDNEAIFAADHSDRQTAFFRPGGWYRLEALLSYWYSLILAEKMVATPAKPTNLPSGLADAGLDDFPSFYPWTALPYSDNTLKETLAYWARLVEAIDERLPMQSDTEPNYGIYDETTLDRAGIPPGFAREFLSKAHNPRAPFIAPGMRIASPSEFVDQPFRKTHLPEHYLEGYDGLFPISFLRGEELAPIDTKTPFKEPWNALENVTYPSGLYLEGSRRDVNQPSEEGCRLILPYGIGSNSHAMRNDLSYLGANAYANTFAEAPPPTDVVGELYQNGFNPFGDWVNVELAEVLLNWRSMVEAGEWTVGEHGVADGIEKWRDADTEAKAYMYTIGWADWLLKPQAQSGWRGLIKIIGNRQADAIRGNWLLAVGSWILIVVLRITLTKLSSRYI